MRQAGLFCLGGKGEGGRDMRDDKKKVTEGLLKKVEKGKEKELDTKEQSENLFFGRLPKML